MEFKKNLGFMGEPVCTIDLNEFKVGELVVLTPCSHLFHPKCIKQWLGLGNREKACPNCKYSLVNVEFKI